MRAYFQLFFGLLIPLSALFVVAAIIYFNLEYDFNKAIRLGVLTGVFIGVPTSLFIALFLLISRAGEKTKNAILDKRKRRTQKTISKAVTTESVKTVHTPHPVTPKIKKDLTPATDAQGNEIIAHTIMLLMDKELAFDVAMYAIIDEKIGTLTESKDKEDHITVKKGDEIVQIEVTPLTRHTAQVIIKSNTHSESTQKIIRYMKNKEYSFLQY